MIHTLKNRVCVLIATTFAFSSSVTWANSGFTFTSIRPGGEIRTVRLVDGQVEYVRAGKVFDVEPRVQADAPIFNEQVRTILKENSEMVARNPAVLIRFCMSRWEITLPEHPHNTHVFCGNKVMLRNWKAEDIEKYMNNFSELDYIIFGAIMHLGDEKPDRSPSSHKAPVTKKTKLRSQPSR